jgi:hypothetical protein
VSRYASPLVMITAGFQLKVIMQVNSNHALAGESLVRFRRYQLQCCWLVGVVEMCLFGSFGLRSTVLARMIAAVGADASFFLEDDRHV